MVNEKLEQWEPIGIAPGAARKERVGWSFDVPGECLDPDSAIWTEEQRANGIKLRCVFLTSDDEEKAAVSAMSSGSAAQNAVGRECIIRSIRMIGAGGADLGNEAWKIVPHPFRASIWDGVGPIGRPIIINAYSRAHAMSEGVKKKIEASFRLEV